MRTIICKDSKMYPFKLEKWGRVKSIKWDVYGRPYFRVKNSRVYMDDVLSMTYPYFYDDEDGRLGYISGYYYITYFMSVYVEVLNDGESVQLWTEVK